MNLRKKNRIRLGWVIALVIIISVLSYPRLVNDFPWLYNKISALKINLGLDLQGGIHLEYKADMTDIEKGKESEALQAVQSVVERRVNAFGVGEAVVQTTQTGGEYRVIVELPGVKDIEEAKKKIKDTPLLEFREENSDTSQGMEIINGLNDQTLKQAQQVLIQAQSGSDFTELAKQNSQDPGTKDKGGDLDFVKKGALVPEFDEVLFNPDFKDGEVWPSLVETQYGWHIIKKIESRGEGDNLEIHAQHILFRKASLDMIPDLKYSATGLTGKNLKDVQVVFQNQGLGEPQVSLKFDEEGTKLFAEITKRNVGKPLAIFLDGELKSAPNVQQEITTGEAVISGNFTVDDANRLKSLLNEGALPTPLELVSQQSVEATLGAESLHKSFVAGLVGLGLVIVFMIGFYRFLGLVASVALLIYTGLMLSIFKLSTLSPWSITLTLSGIAGFILSIGMAVDANILIFERTKEEIKKGRNMASAISEGFRRAWTSIRDGNVSSLITAFILYSLGTGFVRGFAATLFLGVVVSMFTAITVTQTLLVFLVREWMHEKLWLIGAKNEAVTEKEL